MKKTIKRFAKLLMLSLLGLIVIFCVRLLLPQATLSAGQPYQSLIINNVSIIDNRDKVINFMNLCNKSNSKKTLKTCPSLTKGTKSTFQEIGK